MKTVASVFWFFVVGLLFAPSVTSTEQGTKTVPLTEVWAYQMPGTRDIRDLEPEKFGAAIRALSTKEQIKKMGSSMTGPILTSLQSKKSKDPATKGFVVVGSGLAGLTDANEVLVGGRK